MQNMLKCHNDIKITILVPVDERFFFYQCREEQNHKSDASCRYKTLHVGTCYVQYIAATSYDKRATEN